MISASKDLNWHEDTSLPCESNKLLNIAFAFPFCEVSAELHSPCGKINGYLHIYYVSQVFLECKKISYEQFWCSDLPSNIKTLYSS